ncbi:LacI family DNA-binding transcriptional regulator [Ectobacillus funiculus]|uniref:LacI family DNA-binding transcriptional regulator n=1 Tax=Ectobacillus funiculus TaxID=137993 RepID=UPI00101CEC35|nr:LacI family DNA-binding transcriptional regulator [Ectobacillus funiculus]
MMKMIDVAKRANVSTATVSRVLRKPDKVSKDTREKVLAAIKELNYQPNMVARQFRTKETKTVLVVIPDVTSPFFSEVLRGIEHIALESGYRVILGDTENNINREHEYIELLLQQQADGMILLTARMDRARLEEIANQFPVVLACEYIDELDVPTVSIDNISAARKATEHFIQLGHTRIAHIAGPMNVILSRDRLKGYEQALISHQLPIDPLYIKEGDFSLESGYNQMLHLLELEVPPTAVFVFNDLMAIGAIKAVKDKGLRVPEDIAVVGFDNIKMTSVFEPNITTIDQPKYEIGKKAMDLLLNLMNGETLERKKFVLKDELIIRESSGFKRI